MKLFITSDLHLDDYKQEQNEDFAQRLPEADVLVLAGDYTNGSQKLGKFVNFLELVKSKYKHIVLVLGNHDHWGSNHELTYATFRATLANLGSQIHLMEEDFLVLPDFSDYIFYGGTLWYTKFHRLWIDERNSTNPGEPNRYNNIYKQNLLGLDTQGKKLIVVSHHLPSTVCIAPAFIGSFTNDYFVDASCEQVIHAVKPIMWIHGHTHEPVDKMYETTHIVANPRGYYGEHDSKFEARVVERTYEI